MADGADGGGPAAPGGGIPIPPFEVITRFTDLQSIIDWVGFSVHLADDPRGLLKVSSWRLAFHH